ncbi:glycosyltransferase family 2 protein [Desulfobaculum bizertense]|uniref:Glycosyltransferase involved in cell wall bisynthesis n=1 Tax=Desulfobaculum bizertense DSM 18034 TaxID=1121442 RepID=A0A1T4WYF9_9BACT|nr:glycosyltransferase family 2 protein [Desulfobaculum bizertense]SKA82344.1 Glycosyltransferase involved in cell wall bisynthesis [Desulfobaculum bizertense DSM 18034]
MSKKLISIVTGCYNEEGNIKELNNRIRKAMSQFPQYDYEIICIDNCSTDGTRAELSKICDNFKNFRAIFNVRNFGHIRSPWHAFLLAKGDAVIAMASDLEDPPELIPQMISKWEEGYTLALAVRTGTEEKGILPIARKAYYWLIKRLSDVDQISGFTGFGLYDKSAMDVFRSLNEPYPYVRGLITEMGWKRAEIPFFKPQRTRGFTKGNFMIYLDTALLGIVNHSRLPLRCATIMGLFVSGGSFFAGLYYMIHKLLAWNSFQAGVAPLIIGLFFLMGLLFLLLGLIGEYIGLIVTHVTKRPLVIEEKRINFNENPH